MNRRDFLRLSSMTGISLMLLPSGSRAADVAWKGPYFLHMHAAGGWDPTIFCDGKLTSEGYANKLVTQVGQVGGVPVPTATAQGRFLLRRGGNPFEDPKHFFETVGKHLRVFNGVDTQTNNHETGVQGFACGNNDIELPSIAALHAGMVSRKVDVPMAFLASGGAYNRTDDVVSVSRFPGDKIGALASPYAVDGPTAPGLLSTYAAKRMEEVRAERMKALAAQATLPRMKRTLTALDQAARSGPTLQLLSDIAKGAAPTFESFQSQLPPDAVDYLGQKLNPNDANSLTRFVDNGRPLEQILRCFQAGVSVSATYAQGGFDTHGNHDNAQQDAMSAFVSRLRYVILRAEQMGIRDKLCVLVTSDFGRTPMYNSDAGRDHWNVTSALIMAPGVSGGMSIGQSDPNFRAMRVAKSNVRTVLPDNDGSGSRVRSSHMHRELRRVLALDEIAKPFALPSTSADDALPLLA